MNDEQDTIPAPFAKGESVTLTEAYNAGYDRERPLMRAGAVAKVLAPVGRTTAVVEFPTSNTTSLVLVIPNKELKR